MAFVERIRWLGRMALLAFILGAAAFLSAITTIRFAIQGREVEVPSLAGLKAGDAQTRLAQRGLGLRIADRVYSDQPVDFVIRQSPSPGTRVKQGQGAHVVLSLGQRKLPIPALEGQTLRNARIALLRAGLQLGEVSSLHVPEAEPDFIVKQHPPAGSMGAGSPRVNMLVSLGEREAAYAMPDLLGLPLTEAQTRLTAAGLRLTRLTAVPTPDALRSTVIQQTPSRGARINPGTAIELQVAD